MLRERALSEGRRKGDGEKSKTHDTQSVGQTLPNGSLSISVSAAEEEREEKGVEWREKRQKGGKGKTMPLLAGRGGSNSK